MKREDPAGCETHSGGPETWARANPFFTAIRGWVRSIIKGPSHSRERRIVANSGLFDAEWYVEQYPDIRHFSHGPLEHFLEFGGSEERSPSAAFDTKAYRAAYPDVDESGINPLLHYLLYGASEGRKKSGLAERQLFRSRRKARGQKRDASFSLLIRHGSARQLAATLKSLGRQIDAPYEIVAITDDLTFRRRLQSFAEASATPGSAGMRVATVPNAGNALSEALRASKNEFIIVLDAGDVLRRDALLYLSRHIRKLGCDVLYTDEIEHAGGDPILKPSWSPELLVSYNYFGRLTAICRELAIECNEDLTCSGAAEWELHLRLGARTQAIDRLPMILCERSTPLNFDRNRALSGERQDYESVLKAHWNRQGFDARVRVQSDGTLHAAWELSSPPFVSIIIPNKDRADLLKTFADGLYNRTSYKNFELIVVDNGSVEAGTEKLYEELLSKSARIVDFDEEFNYSRACNLGAACARGELLLFANNDMEVIRADWLEELVRYILLPGIGIVGPKLLYPGGEIQHAGVAVGMFTLAAHLFSGAKADEWGPFGSANVQRNCMAVTGACQLVRREIFELIHGYDERFLLAYSDIVLCIQIYRAGFRIAYVPSSVLIHHEGKSRGNWTPRSDQVFFALSLRSLGIAEDPYFHPALELFSFVPKFRGPVTSLDGNPQLMKDIGTLAGEANQAGVVDVYDDGEVAEAAGVPWSWVAWPFYPLEMEPSLESAARILIELIRRRRDLRVQFPRALSDGARGGFATWVKDHGLRLLGLGNEYSIWIDAAFEAELGNTARQMLLYNEQLREEEPLLLLPEGRSAACRRLFEAVQDGTVTMEAVWWFLVTSAENPLGELFATWALAPDWQEAVPDGGTAFGAMRLVKWVSERYGITSDWLFEQAYPTIMSAGEQVRLAYAANSEWRENFPRAMFDGAEARALIDYLATRASGLPFLARSWVAGHDNTELLRAIDRPGVNILGHFAYPSGLRISTESIVESLRVNDVMASLRNVPVSRETDNPIGHRFTGCEVYDTTIIHVQPEPFFSSVYARSGLRPKSPQTYRIGYWYWESDETPPSWNRAAFDCDELWTATEFIAEGLRQRYKQPIRVFFPGLEIAQFELLPKSYFGLDDSKFNFLFVFHMTSIMERKNPLALIKAFRSAFDPLDDARLIIKTTFGSSHPEQFTRLKEAALDADVRLIDESFSREETLSLIANCDAYVSLHRSEGLGLTLAEAMLLGRPVIATGYSGNMSFMHGANSLLVDYKLVTLNSVVPPYKIGQLWAKPSVKHAAAHMRHLYNDRAFAAELGQRAKEDLQRRLNFRVSGETMAKRLSEISAEVESYAGLR